MRSERRARSSRARDATRCRRDATRCQCSLRLRRYSPPPPRRPRERVSPPPPPRPPRCRRPCMTRSRSSSGAPRSVSMALRHCDRSPASSRDVALASLAAATVWGSASSSSWVAPDSRGVEVMPARARLQPRREGAAHRLIAVDAEPVDVRTIHRAKQHDERARQDQNDQSLPRGAGAGMVSCSLGWRPLS